MDEHAAGLARDIATRADHLRREVEGQDPPEQAFSEIRELRHELNTLEEELRDGPDTSLGDAS